MIRVLSSVRAIAGVSIFAAAMFVGAASGMSAGAVNGVSASLQVALGADDEREHSIRLRDGSRWRGKVGALVDLTYLEQRVEIEMTGTVDKVADLYIVIEGEIMGQLRKKTIFRDDVISMTAADASGSARNTSGETRGASSRPKKGDAAAESTGGMDSKHPGVIVLPLEGFVGGPFRREEITKVGEKADEYGPGQIIVLRIKSDGGSSLESQFIAEEIFKLRERHRVVAWIEKAISAGCQTAMCCEEIYFMTEGTAGAVTTWNPGSGQSIKGEELERAMDHLVDIAERSGYSEHIARAMKTNDAVCSYDKDEKTGEVTFYGDASGEFLLSDDDSNLSFNSSNALHSGFSHGTADTTDELAALLDLPEWNEVTDYGRKIAKSWQRTVETAEKEIPRLIARRGYYKSSGSAEERIGAMIKIDEDLLRWHRRCPNIAMMQAPPEEFLKREIAELRKQLADMRRR